MRELVRNCLRIGTLTGVGTHSYVASSTPESRDSLQSIFWTKSAPSTIALDPSLKEDASKRFHDLQVAIDLLGDEAMDAFNMFDRERLTTIEGKLRRIRGMLVRIELWEETRDTEKRLAEALGKRTSVRNPFYDEQLSDRPKGYTKVDASVDDAMSKSGLLTSGSLGIICKGLSQQERKVLTNDAIPHLNAVHQHVSNMLQHLHFATRDAAKNEHANAVGKRPHSN